LGEVGSAWIGFESTVGKLAWNSGQALAGAARGSAKPSDADTMMATQRNRDAMTTHTTKAGTEIVELTDEEFQAYLESEAQASLGVSTAEFLEQVARGDVDWDDPDSMYVAGLLGVNGAKR
jgi:hypothetical protein